MVHSLRRWIIARMFVAPADETYLLARFSVLAGLPDSFAWLANHTLEKYLKAALLLRDQDVKDENGQYFRHDTLSIYQKAVKIDPGLRFPEFSYPEEFPETLRSPEELQSTLERFNKEGDPHSRYGIRGHRVFADDLLKLDRMVFHLRTRCRSYRLTSDEAIIGSREDSVEALHLETFWSIDPGGILERALKAAAGLPDTLPMFARSGNVAFLQANAPRPTRMPSSFGTGAFPAWLFPTKEAEAGPGTLRAVEEVLQWAQDSIQLPSELKPAIRQALSEIARTREPSAPPP